MHTGGVNKLNRSEMLSLALDNVNRAFGAGTVVKMGDAPRMDIETIPTGNVKIDLALKIGGLPKGRIIEIFGREASGKTTVALQVVAAVQRAGGFAIYIDTEYAFNPAYAEKIGVDINELYISQPNDGEEAFEVCETAVRSGAIDVVVIDSVSALVPRAEIEGSYEDCPAGLHARLMSQGLRKLNAILSQSGCTLVFVNQMRYDIRNGKEISTGGRALKYYSSIRLKVGRVENIVSNNMVVGSRIAINVVKNKVAPPGGECTLDLVFGMGISCEKDMLEVALEKKYLQRSGKYYFYQGDRIGTNVAEAIQYLVDNPDVYEELDELVHKGYVSRIILEPATDDDDELRMLYEEASSKGGAQDGEGKDNEGDRDFYH